MSLTFQLCGCLLFASLVALTAGQDGRSLLYPFPPDVECQEMGPYLPSHCYNHGQPFEVQSRLAGPQGKYLEFHSIG